MASRLFEFRVPRVVIAGYDALARLAAETKAVGGRKGLVITDPGVAKSGALNKVTQALADQEARQAGRPWHPIPFEVFDAVQPEPPIACAEAALAALKKARADFVIGVGGGSSMDVAKVVAMLAVNGGDVRQYFGEGKVPRRGLRTILIPTTAGTGSEVSPIAMLTDPAERLKKGIVSWNILADLAVVDPEMSRTTPPRVTAATGMDALTHAIEGMFSVLANPVTDGICLESAHLIATHLPRAFRNPDDMEARHGMAIASMMAGMVLGNSSVTIVHALAYPLGARYNVPHGVANSVMLVPVMEFNKDVLPGRPRTARGRDGRATFRRRRRRPPSLERGGHEHPPARLGRHGRRASRHGRGHEQDHAPYGEEPEAGHGGRAGGDVSGGVLSIGPIRPIGPIQEPCGGKTMAGNKVSAGIWFMGENRDRFGATRKGRSRWRSGSASPERPRASRGWSCTTPTRSPMTRSPTRSGGPGKTGSRS